MNRRILIIEDDPDIANVFRKQLELKGGYDVELAEGGQRGLEVMTQSSYDLVFMDLVMPEVDGVEVLSAVKDDPAKYNHPKIMALTNVTSEETKKEVEELGAIKFIVKTDTDIDVIVDEFFGANVNKEVDES